MRMWRALLKVYECSLTAPIPQAAQIMGSDPELMAAMAVEMERRRAPRIDLNCGCPSNTVTGRGAGSSLLKDPNHLYQVAHALVKAVAVPVTAKLRIGFNDTSLFRENILAAQESGVKFITLHARTKVDGYKAPARWEYIAEAKSLLKIPVVGNGDILNVADALRMLQETRCDGLMIGRGAVINPLLFHDIRNHFAGRQLSDPLARIRKFLTLFVAEMPIGMTERGKMSKLKQIFSFLFQKNSALQERRQQMLTAGEVNVQIMLERNLPIIESLWS